MPAAAVTPASRAYVKVAVVEKLVVEIRAWYEPVGLMKVKYYREPAQKGRSCAVCHSVGVQCQAAILL